MLDDRQEMPAWVEFEVRPMEDKKASREQGQIVYKDVEWALITPPYSKDCVEQKVDRWLDNMEKNIRNGRCPPKWAEQWKNQYKAWKNGLEAPIDGTDIKNWAAITPSQIKSLLQAEIRTVESLAGINDEGLRRIGMGGVDLKNKAVAYVKAAKDHGPVVMENASLKKEVEQLKGTVDSLKGMIERLHNQKGSVDLDDSAEVESAGITASDILDDSSEDDGLEEARAAYMGKFGKAPHHFKKAPSIWKEIQEAS